MIRKELGRTGYEVTALGFGGMELHYLHDDSAYELLNTALDLGINYVDTSPEYPMSEYYIGKSISHRRDEFILATKCGDNMQGYDPLYIFDRKTIMENIDMSLKLLKTDHVDILQLHGVTPELLPGGRYDEAIQTILDIKAAGKALHLGLTVCNKGPGMYGYPAGYGYNSILRFAPWEEIEVIQLVYGGLTRLSENVIQKAYEDYHTGVIARGILKKYDGTYDERARMARLSELFEEGETLQDFLVRYVISHPGVASALVGTKNVAHLRRNAAAAEKGPLSDDVYAEAKRRLTFAGAIPGPTDMKTDW